mmetsp:Transcript_61709/g.149416  ORF Transcript_61709/g.149416 Transcript_61709/m.149416 type:complete len:285 (-) Transcript_61709:30-884(-)
MLVRWRSITAAALFLGSVGVTSEEAAQTAPARHKFFKINEVEQVIPLPPSSYPAALQGFIWMDQSGFYAHSDVPFSAPDLALSFGDTAFSRLDETTHSVAVDVGGPAWQWMNSWMGYVFNSALAVVGFHYIFQFNEDYSMAQIYPTVNLGWLGTWSLPKLITSFTMVLQKPPKEADACPPKPTASKAERARCAKWDRVSTTWFSPLLGSLGVAHYYVFEIVDAKGRPVQPYYDAYLQWAAQSVAPRPTIAKLFGIDLGAVGQEPNTSFVRVAARLPSAGKDSEL